MLLLTEELKTNPFLTPIEEMKFNRDMTVPQNLLLLPKLTSLTMCFCRFYATN